jgi:hypothetical protein
MALEVNSLLLSLTIIFGWPRFVSSLSSVRATLTPDSDLSATHARDRRVFTAMLAPSAGVSALVQAATSS